MLALGDYSEGAQEGSTEGMLAQIKQIVSPQTTISSCDGDDLKQAVALARQADVVILGLGEFRLIIKLIGVFKAPRPRRRSRTLRPTPKLLPPVAFEVPEKLVFLPTSQRPRSTPTR